MLMTYFDKAINTEWDYNQFHYVKGLMDGVVGTVKNVVFLKVKSDNIVIDSSKEFVDYASQLVPSITSLYLPVEEIIEEPKETARAPAIPGTLENYKVIRKNNSRNISYLEFFNLFDQSIPNFKWFYRKDNDPAICDQIDADEDNNACAY